MEELNCKKVIVWYSYTAELSQCDSGELWKCDSVVDLYCGGVILWYIYILWNRDSVVQLNCGSVIV